MLLLLTNHIGVSLCRRKLVRNLGRGYLGQKTITDQMSEITTISRQKKISMPNADISDKV